MNKLLLAYATAIADVGLAACSDTDNTTTQSVDQPAVEQPAAPDATPVEPTAPADDQMGTDDTTTQSIGEPKMEQPGEEQQLTPAGRNGETPAEEELPAN